ncbi:uncharacterized protein LOC121372633 isoform X2 [Gigantopelta aegis]|uniref:uncharacterized protein LOC121372633 isoform X2 n=1 Tax=Gigantopelta aegis TaxID=1735272 RepID=UPI001B888472|nr:uncharacterized protein LOC121372633 isoform X2 [Gigantopelta aegis]
MKTIHCVCMIPGLLVTCMGSLDLSGSPAYPDLNQTYTLTCTVNDEINEEVITFHDPRGEFGMLTQTLAGCSVAKLLAAADYDASCGHGTNGRLNRTRIYTLTIKRVTVNDTAEWFCQGTQPLRRSEGFTLALKLRGAWSSWVQHLGACQSDCRRTVSHTRTCDYPDDAPQERLLPCLGGNKDETTQGCLSDGCNKGLSLSSKVAIMITVTSVLLLIAMVLTAWCFCRSRIQNTAEKDDDKELPVVVLNPTNEHPSTDSLSGCRQTLQCLLETRREAVEHRMDTRRQSIQHILEDYSHVTTSQDIIRKYSIENVDENLDEIAHRSRLSRSLSISGAQFKKKTESTTSGKILDNDIETDVSFTLDKDKTDGSRRVTFTLPKDSQLSERKAAERVYDNPAFEK